MVSVGGSDAIKVPSIALCSPYSRLAPPCCPFSFCSPRPTFGLSCNIIMVQFWLLRNREIEMECLIFKIKCMLLPQFLPPKPPQLSSNSVQWSKKCLSRDDGLRFEPLLRAAALDGRKRRREAEEANAAANVGQLAG